MRQFTFAACTLAMLLAAAEVQAAGWGDLTGKFVIGGTPPKEDVIKPTKDVEFCGKHKIPDDWLVVGKDKGIKNIVVYLYLKEGEKVPAAHDDYAKTAKDEVVLDNKNCRFEPHVSLLRTTQTLVVGNSDEVGHNTKIDFLENTPQNPLVPAGSKLKLGTFPKIERLPSNVGCSIHGWMTAKVLVRDNPYFAVTDNEGKFTIKNLPEGKWTFQFWHEGQGFLAKELKKDGKALTWAKGRTEFTITPKGTDIGTIEVGATGFKHP